jgi:hypothetical protein
MIRAYVEKKAQDASPLAQVEIVDRAVPVSPGRGQIRRLMGGVTDALVWTKTAPIQHQAKGDAFFYIIHEVEQHFEARAFSRGDGTIDVQVAEAVEPTLDAGKQAAQLWESNGPMPKARAGRVRVYFRGYVEYNVNDTVKLMDAVGFGEAAGVPEDKKVGSLIQHTINRFQMKNQFAIDGAEAESLRVSASSQPSAEGPVPI